MTSVNIRMSSRRDRTRPCTSTAGTAGIHDLSDQGIAVQSISTPSADRMGTYWASLPPWILRSVIDPEHHCMGKPSAAHIKLTPSESDLHQVWRDHKRFAEPVMAARISCSY